MKLFVYKSTVKKADGVAELLKIDVTNKNTRCNYKEVDVGVAANKELVRGKLSDAQRVGFRMKCLQFLPSTVEKLLERSPLKYSLVHAQHAVSCLVPSSLSLLQ